MLTIYVYGGEEPYKWNFAGGSASVDGFTLKTEAGDTGRATLTGEVPNVPEITLPIEVYDAAGAFGEIQLVGKQLESG